MQNRKKIMSAEKKGQINQNNELKSNQYINERKANGP